ncbi:MAG TPA: beta-galactosidase [Thermomicrobiales bacterium]|nr:beta-galactosidase [Thermomicrobiales bacterium]
MASPGLPPYFSLGVCYYPEHWPSERWPIYARQMREIGLSYARLAEFAWSRIEPTEGNFEWEWLDHAIETLAAEDLGVILGTPTGSPPPWLLTKYPEILPVDKDGRTRTHGSRKHYDHASPIYRRYCQEIVAAMAQRYGDHPAVIGWQIDNEWGESDSTASYGPVAQHAFQDWLWHRYHTLPALNEAWGGVFWSQEYIAWDQVPLPNLTMNDPNPSHVLDFQRFATACITEFQNLQVDIIRAASPGRFITHNGMGNFEEVDYYRCVESLDFMAWDSYPLGQIDKGLLHGLDPTDWIGAGHPDLISINHDLMRGLKPGASTMVMEQQAGQVNWAQANPLPAANAVALWTMQAWAHGCDSVCYFRWRAATAAQELMHSGLLRHDESLDRGGQEIANLELPIGPLQAVTAKVVLLHDYESGWVANEQRHTQAWSYWKQMMLFYSTLRRLGVDVDIRHPDADLSAYAVIVAPCLHIVTPERAEHLREAAQNSHLVVGPRTGFRTESGRVPEDGQPGLLRDLLGCTLLNFDGMWPGTTIEAGGEEVTIWAEAYQPTTAQVLHTYDSGPLQGEAAVVRNGKVTTIGAFSSLLIARVLAQVLAQAGIAIVPLDEGLRRSSRGGRTLWMNFNDNERRLPDGRHIPAHDYILD